MPSTNTAASAAQTLAQRTFSLADQETFANMCGDRNPLHVDEVAARRLITGQPVVHGVHLLLQALEHWASGKSCGINSIECSFDQPVSINDLVTFEQRELADGKWHLTASVSASVCASITLFSSVQAPAKSRPASAPVESKLSLRKIDGLLVPLDEAPGSQLGVTMLLPLTGSTADANFPQAAKVISVAAVKALAGLSYFVGMVCPGMHSIFSALRLSIANQAGGTDALEFGLQRHDPRFNLFIVNFSGALEGELRAFRRPPPQTQSTACELRQIVQAEEFAGTNALVVGGSRGLGELTAKLLGAGGANVLITYAKGKDDALRVAADINSAGPGTCTTLGMDLQNGNWADLKLDTSFDTVFYFATPRIFRKKTTVFDTNQFADFCHFYLEQFQNLCLLLESRALGRDVKVYLPSTVFIETRPKGMTEYAAAKAASEVLADDLNRTLRHVKIIHSRLPRMATDQTSSVMELQVSSNVEVMLPVVRMMSQRPDQPGGVRDPVPPARCTGP